MVLQVPPLSPPKQHSRVNVNIWQACTGKSVQTPKINSRVYYFPQGHMENSSSPMCSLPFFKPYVLCRIIDVNFFADSDTDEVFVKLNLHPIDTTHLMLQSSANPDGVEAAVASDDSEKIESCTKTLTRSDANNGGGFSVPRQCAEQIFPKLDLEEDPPVQQLSLIDVHGVTWKFRHVYRGTPLRHLLTTGWSKFVNSKRLVYGDSVVFMRDTSGKNFVGIRRAGDPAESDDNDKVVPEWLAEIANWGKNDEKDKKKEEEVPVEPLKKIPAKAKAIAEALELAAENKPFEVVYYPRIGWSEFVVNAEDVDKAMGMYWQPGMRVKMSRESADSTKVTWLQGAVSAVTTNSGPEGCSSPWRMLQILWDEPESECLKDVKMVSAWEVIPLSGEPPSIDEILPPEEFLLPMSQVNQSLFPYGTTSPADAMQLDRHDQFFARNNTENYSSENITAPRFQDLSPNSADIVRTPQNSNTVNNTTTAVGSNSFFLFGVLITPGQPGEGLNRDDNNNGTTEGLNEDDNNNGTTEGLNEDDNNNETTDNTNPSLNSELVPQRVDDPLQEASNAFITFL